MPKKLRCYSIRYNQISPMIKYLTGLWLSRLHFECAKCFYRTINYNLCRHLRCLYMYHMATFPIFHINAYKIKKPWSRSDHGDEEMRYRVLTSKGKQMALLRLEIKQFCRLIINNSLLLWDNVNVHKVRVWTVSEGNR